LRRTCDSPRPSLHLRGRAHGAELHERGRAVRAENRNNCGFADGPDRRVKLLSPPANAQVDWICGSLPIGPFSPLTGLLRGPMLDFCCRKGGEEEATQAHPQRAPCACCHVLSASGSAQWPATPPRRASVRSQFSGSHGTSPYGASGRPLASHFVDRHIAIFQVRLLLQHRQVLVHRVGSNYSARLQLPRRTGLAAPCPSARSAH
jgi:hypothetical protein